MTEYFSDILSKKIRFISHQQNLCSLLCLLFLFSKESTSSRIEYFSFDVYNKKTKDKMLACSKNNRISICWKTIFSTRFVFAIALALVISNFVQFVNSYTIHNNNNPPVFPLLRPHHTRMNDNVRCIDNNKFIHCSGSLSRNICTRQQQQQQRRQRQLLSLDLFGGSIHTAEHGVSVAGSIWPIFQKLHITPLKLQEIIKNVKIVTQWQEIIILPLIAFTVFPITKWFLYQRAIQLVNDAGIDNDIERKQEIKSIMKTQRKELFSTYNYASLIATIGQVAFSVYIVDVISVVLTSIGFKFPKRIELSTSYAKIAYTTLIISKLLAYKERALCKFFRVSPSDMGQLEIINRILDFVLVSIGTLLTVDWLKIRVNNAMTGILAFSSIGTLAFTLASQGLVTEFLSGIVLIFGNKMNSGDTVIFGDGTSGKVIRIGWLETLFRGPDNIETRVPNALLSSQKVSNVSRVRICRVDQTLRFRYEDSKKLPKLMDDIRNEILASCPRLITDASIRPFRVYWTDFKEDHLEVIVDTHHKIAPNSEEYYRNRQNMLSAILRAVENNNVELQHA